MHFCAFIKYAICLQYQKTQSFYYAIKPQPTVSLPSLSPPGGCSSSGLSPEYLSASLATVQSLATACGADMMVLRQRPGEVGSTAECLIRRKVEEDHFLEVR